MRVARAEWVGWRYRRVVGIQLAGGCAKEQCVALGGGEAVLIELYCSVVSIRHLL